MIYVCESVMRDDMAVVSRMGTAKLPRRDAAGLLFNSTTVTKHVGRNDPCPCGSGKKHKKCCLKKQNSSSSLVD